MKTVWTNEEISDLVRDTAKAVFTATCKWVDENDDKKPAIDYIKEELNKIGINYLNDEDIQNKT